MEEAQAKISVYAREGVTYMSGGVSLAAYRKRARGYEHNIRKREAMRELAAAEVDRHKERAIAIPELYEREWQKLIEEEKTKRKKLAEEQSIHVAAVELALEEAQQVLFDADCNLEVAKADYASWKGKK